MIIDALTHIHPNPDSFGNDSDLSPEFIIAELNQSPVDKAIVTAIAADNHYSTSTEFVIEQCTRYPDHLIGFASVNPLTNLNAVADFESYIKNDGMRGLKLHPRHQHFGADDTRIVPVVEKAAELGVPITICGSQWKHAPLRDQMPMNIDILAKRVPKANIIIAHGGGFHFMDAFVVAIANENVYLETSISLNYFADTPFEDQYIFTLKQLGAHRIIYGSDHPEAPLATCYTQSKALLGKHNFTQEEQAKILGENIQRLIGL
jgi:uncharacterized protein